VSHFSRRDFLQQTSAAVAAAMSGAALAAEEEKKEEPKPADSGDKPRIGFIGTAGMGGTHIKKFNELGIVCPCYCDVDTSRQKEAAKLFPDAKTYQDYRKMLDKHAKELDGVVIGVPDHHHYPATIIAMQLGLACYTQKPLTHTVWEARELTKAWAKYKLPTQMGNQGHAGEGWRLVYEWINSGMLGDVTEVHSWTNRPIWPQGFDRPKGEDKVPDTLDWDLWLGPAPKRPYKGERTEDPDKGKGWYHPFAWRGWYDFGCGSLGDMGCHTLDGVFWAMDPGYPTAVEPVAIKDFKPETFPSAAILKWEFPAKGKRPAFAAYWYDAGLIPGRPIELEKDRKMPKTGNLFIGTKAKLLVSGDYGDSPRIIPESRMKEIGKPPKMLERSPGHYEEWYMAVKGEKPYDFPKSNFSYAGPMTETVNLGNVALRVQQRIEWDGPNLKVTNLPEANEYITKKYRQGWKF